jgi:hypothetical protein
MTGNDAIVLGTHFDAWKERFTAVKGVDPWLYYTIEQFLKPYALDDDDTLAGITDSGNDGGADGIYFLVNHRQMVTEETDVDPKTVSKVHLNIFQVKHSGGFRPTEVEKWLTFADDFLDLSKDPKDFGQRYNDKIKTAMRVWRDHYLEMSIHFPEVAADFYYVTATDAQTDNYVTDSCDRVKAVVTKHLGAKCEVNIHCVGAHELWAQVQKRPPKTRPLRWAEAPMTTEAGFVGLVKLKDLRDFLEAEPGVLAERIFESNVRGYQDDSAVNNQIAATLAAPNGPNFWMLNNGVTIIAPQASAAGHRILNIDDPQIVNGLQTSRVIFDFFTKNPQAVDARTVLVRVIETSDQAVQDRIIRATNSQNKMQPASLRMTDPIHRDIEAMFKKVDLFYDRRKGFYRDQGKPLKKIVSVNTVAQAVISILLQRPDDARARPGDYFKDEAKYESVFGNSKIQINAYLHCLQMLRRVEEFIETTEMESRDEKNVKFYVTALLAREVTGLEMPVGPKLPAISKVEDKTIAECLRRVLTIYSKLSRDTDRDAVARGAVMLKRINAQWKRRANGAK